MSAIRLIYTETNGAEHHRDFATVTEAREAVCTDWADWVIIEVAPGSRYGHCGRVLDSIAV